MRTQVTLGDIEFDLGPRHAVRKTSTRVIAKIDIPGGPPEQQDMGADEDVISWSGSIIGPDALQKVSDIEAMKDVGLPVDLVIYGLDPFNAEVLIRRFEYQVVRTDRLDYDIELVVAPPPPPPTAVTLSAAAARPTGAPAAPTPTPKVHVVRQGDTLWSLAQKYLGAGTRWREIAKANGVADPRQLRVGQRLIIPG
ncbi:MAG: LysM domain-containing protein [Bacillota bacterium]|nr:LysM domain-containing protein [Bacillota bacterium]